MYTRECFFLTISFENPLGKINRRELGREKMRNKVREQRREIWRDLGRYLLLRDVREQFRDRGTLKCTVIFQLYNIN